MISFDFLQAHPFAIEAFFEHSIVLTYAVDPKEVAGMLPPFLELDLHKDGHAFLAVALVSTRSLRPAGFPVWAGQNFFLIGYRLFVRYTNSAGRRLRGLFILRSETNRRRMVLLGNLFTHYKYRHIDSEVRHDGAQFDVKSKRGALDVSVTIGEPSVSLPMGSPFVDWHEARLFAGPMPFTFSQDSQGNAVIIEGVRETWKPMPLSVQHAQVGFLEEHGLGSARLANAFIVQGVQYRWQRGVVESQPHRQA